MNRTLRIDRAELVYHRPGPPPRPGERPCPRTTLLLGFDHTALGDGLVAVADLRDWDGALATIPWRTEDADAWRFRCVERTRIVLHFSRPDRDTPLLVTL